jgi:hypothetical protein
LRSSFALCRAEYAAGAATNSKAVGLCRRLCVRPMAPSSGKAPLGCRTEMSNRLGGELQPRVPLMPRDQGPDPTKRSIVSARSASSGFFAAAEHHQLAAARFQINAELEPPTGSKPSRPSRRGCNRTRICSLLRRKCTGRSCGVSAESARRGEHSLRPRTLQAMLVMSNNQDPSPDR